MFIATATADDEEMRARIERHRADRPRSWQTIEEPLDLEKPLLDAPAGTCVVVDCLNLWVSNLMLEGLADDAIEERAAGAAKVAAGRPETTIAVSNEVGSSIHPATALGRRFVDLLGTMNVSWAGAADHAFLVVAGRKIALDD